MEDNLIVAKVDEELWDLTRPLEKDCTVEVFEWDADAEVQRVFWHSSAHILGYALEKELDCKLSVGPALQRRFFYEGETKRPIMEQDYVILEKVAQEVIRRKYSFQRLVLTKQQALEMFSYNAFKTYILFNKVPEGSNCVVYRCGNFIDPCRGPHLPNTDRIRGLSHY